MKNIKHAVAVVIKNKNNKTLFVKRSKNKKSYSLVWSLPSHFVKENEDFKDTIKRIGKNKLGLNLELSKLLIEDKEEKQDFVLFMHVFETEVVDGNIKINPNEYIEFKFEKPKRMLNNIEILGSCTKLYKKYLTLNNMENKNE